MGEYSNKYLDSTGVKHLWDKADSIYQKKEEGKVLSDENFSSAEKEKLAGLENYSLPTASDEVLGGIKIGEGLVMDEHGVVRTVYNPEMDIEWDTITDLPTTLEGYGITDAATKDELDVLDEKINEVREEVSKVYKYKGKVSTYADLADIEDPQNGDVYDVEEDGMNYAWNADEERWDNLGTIVNIDSLSNYELDVIIGCASSEAALKEILSNGGNADLSANIALTEAVTIDKDTELDLNHYTLSGNVEGYMLTADNAKLTLKNGNVNALRRIANAVNGGEIVIKSGTYSSGDVAMSAIGEGSKITFDGGDLTAVEGGLGAFDGAELEINGGTITGTDNFPVFTNGTAGRGGNTIVMNGGDLVGNIASPGYEACGVYIANSDSFTMNGGTITSNGGCGILMRAGNVVINDGEITAIMGDHVPGYVGDKKKVMSASAVIYDEASNYPGKAGMSLVINGGTFVGADHAVEILSNEATPNVEINGGSFTPAV